MCRCNCLGGVGGPLHCSEPISPGLVLPRRAHHFQPRQLQQPHKICRGAQSCPCLPMDISAHAERLFCRLLCFRYYSRKVCPLRPRIRQSFSFDPGSTLRRFVDFFYVFQGQSQDDRSVLYPLNFHLGICGFNLTNTFPFLYACRPLSCGYETTCGLCMGYVL
eukprot:SAG31_NODE_71_length_28115_cov_4.128105_24_plen_163_part_00